MKKFLIALLTLMPLLASAQDNTWERIAVEEQPKDNPDAKYLEPNAVPEVDGQVMWQTTLYAEGKTADEIYDILLKQLTKMVSEPNQIGPSTVVVQDREKHNLGAIFHEWLVFKNVMFSLDRTQMTFQTARPMSSSITSPTTTTWSVSPCTIPPRNGSPTSMP